MAEKKKPPPIIHLSYSKGEQIIKEGDYGISIYKIFKGHVRTFRTSRNAIIPLAILERGDVFGEMAFFNLSLEPRSASAEAIDDVELEVWHPARLTEEYKAMPAILRYSTQQILNRLLRMNRIIDELSTKKNKKVYADPEVAKRKYFRKDWNQKFTYGPVSHSSELHLHGVIKDISPLGLGVEVIAQNTLNVDHKPGNHLKILFQLLSGSTINAVAEIKSITKSKVSGYLFLGLKFINISKDASKKIGFFMMS